MEFKNIEKFDAWLKENVKSKVYDLEAFLDDVDKSYGESGILGSNTYELKACETKSGRPELYHYETKEIYYIDDEVVEVCDDYDHVEVVCIF